MSYPGQTVDAAGEVEIIGILTNDVCCHTNSLLIIWALQAYLTRDEGKCYLTFAQGDF